MKINNFIEDLQTFLVKGGNLSKRATKKFIINIISSWDKDDVEELSNLILMSKSAKKCKRCNKLDFADICSWCKEGPSNKTVSIFNSHIDVLELGNYTHDGMSSTFMFGNGDKKKKQNLNELDFEQLESFISDTNANEIILMFDKNIKGEILADYIKSYFKGSKIKVSTLAVGISLGTNIEYLDAETIKLALKNRED